ncbi:TetR/AcrR family transcriptional regulator [Mycoplasmatota bacterium]|nr:TetR/AcrR family transcriptional regulator [Mycoplasmatota bacterium]
MQDKRVKILETANSIITEQGLNKLTLAKLAEEMSMSKGTLYYYYKSKADLLFDLADQYMNMLSHQILKVVNNAKESNDYEMIIENFYKTILEHGARSRIHIYLVHEALSGNEEILGKYQVVYREWLGMIKEGIAQIPNASKNNIEILAQIILSSLDGLVLQSLLGIKDIPLADITKYIAIKM